MTRLDGMAEELVAALDTRYVQARALPPALPKRQCRWCVPNAGPRVFHRACDIHVRQEQEAEVYGRMARIAIDTVRAATYPGAAEDDWLRVTAASAAVYARASATMALSLLGRDDDRPAARELVRCTRCGNTTRPGRPGRGAGPDGRAAVRLGLDLQAGAAVPRPGPGRGGVIADTEQDRAR